MRQFADRGAPVLFVVAVIAACAISSPAQAGTVEARTSDELVFAAAPGETNNLTITQSAGEYSFTVVDDWPLTALGECVSIDMFTAVCTPESNVDVTATLGDLDDSAVIVVDLLGPIWGEDGADTITVTSRLSDDGFANGGRGNDTLVNQQGDNGLNGGGGDDTLTTFASHIFMRGWGGDDVLDGRTVQTIYVDAGPGRDRVMGGYGYDELSGGGGRDVLIGGRGADDISGGAGDDVLKGGPGANRMHGDGGDDLIVGGRHREFYVYGGGGSDTFLMRDGKRDTMRGEGGHDRARIDRRLDRPLGIEVLF